MKRNPVLIFILMLVCVCLAGYFGSWWAPAVVVVIIAALLQLRPGQAILIGALSFLVAFTAMSLFMLGKDSSDLMTKTGILFGGLSPALLLIVTVVTGVITGLVSGWLGSRLGNVLGKRG